jgi:hypothetical protein
MHQPRAGHHLGSADDPEAEQEELQRTGHEPAGAGDHLGRRQLDHRHRERRTGQEGHQRCDHRRQVRLRPALAGEHEGARRDRERRRHRHDHLDARPANTDALEHCDQRPEQCREGEIAPGRLQDQADADRQHHVAQSRNRGPEARPPVHDLPDATTALVR